MPNSRQTAVPADILNKEGYLHSTMKKGESEEFEVKVIETIRELDILPLERLSHQQELRIIALERGLEAVLRRLEESSGPEDEAGWFGRPE